MASSQKPEGKLTPQLKKALELPKDPAIRTIAMPSDVNPGGSIFGGWLLGQMDLAGATVAVKRAQGPVATIAVESMVFHHPVLAGDELSVYATIIETGRTSIKVDIEAWVSTRFRKKIANLVDYRPLRVTEGIFSYVAIDPETRERRSLPAEA